MKIRDPMSLRHPVGRGLQGLFPQIPYHTIYGVLQCVAVCCSVLRAMACMLQCVAARSLQRLFP